MRQGRSKSRGWSRIHLAMAYSAHVRRGRLVDAFILVQTNPGTAARVAEQVRSIEDVTEARMVTGPYDVIARVRVADLHA